MNVAEKEKVTIYLTDYCPYCVRAKAFLDERKISYQTIDLTDDPQGRAQLQARTQWKTVPQIFVGQTFVGGYTDLVELERKGQLQALLDKSE